MSRISFPGRTFRLHSVVVFVSVLLLINTSCTRSENTNQTAGLPDSNIAAGSFKQYEPALPPNPQPIVDMPFDQLMRFSMGYLNEFWGGTFQARLPQYTYYPPKGVYFYNGPFQSRDCGLLEANNAYYCRPPSHSIYYDDGFMRGQYSRGDYAAVNILAHEWGHLVQGNLGTIGDSRYFGIQKELQADCFAGAFAKYLNEKRVLEPGDFEEGVRVLMEVSDSKEVPWFDPAAHGVKAQRTASFYAGWRSGIDGCSMEIQ